MCGLLLWLAGVSFFAHAQVNSWTNSASGKWEDSSSWSLGGPPAGAASVLVTNAANKTITIDATTSGSFPWTMSINNFKLSSPIGSTNTLPLANAGDNPPFTIGGGFTFTNSVLWITNSVLEVGSLTTLNLIVNGHLRLDDGKMTITSAFGGIDVNTGSVTANGGTLFVKGGTIRNNLWLAGGSIDSTETALIIGSHFPPLPAANFWMTGGQLSGVIQLGMYSAGRLTISNGTAAIDLQNIGWGDPGGGNVRGGTLTMAGGTLTCLANVTLGNNISSGTVWMTGGRLTVTNGSLNVGA